MDHLRPVLACLLFLLSSCAGGPSEQMVEAGSQAGLEVATFGAGCFWCSEAALEQIEGVVDVRSGFMGGEELSNPSADDLIEAGHAEVVQVWFDPGRLDYRTLLDWFWRIHDPTSIDRQGADVGPEYRSVLFVRSETQWRMATESRTAVRTQYWRPIQTSVVDAGRFYPASEKHQDYYRKNRESEYCRDVIAPHLESVGLDN